MMTPAERFAALRTLEVAVKEVAASEAETVIQHGSDTGADRWRTAYGTVVIATRDDAPVIADVPGFVAWAKENAPDEVEETVRAAFTKALLARCVVDGDTVIDTMTGEALPFAMVRRGTAYATTPKSDAKDDSVGRWQALLTDRLDAIAGDRPALTQQEEV